MRIFSQQPTLTQMLANNDFDIADIGRKRMALFLVIPDEKTNFHKLVSLFIKQSYEYLIFTAMSGGGKKLENRVFYCLDEFSALPSVADFPAMITAARSRDIRFLLVVQSQSSLKYRYKEEAETIISNCSNWIFFTSRELSLLRDISELCGMQKNNHTPNISTYELQHFSKSKREALLLCGRQKPAKVTMIDIDNYLFSGKSYDIMQMPVSARQERKVLHFELQSETNPPDDDDFPDLPRIDPDALPLFIDDDPIPLPDHNSSEARDPEYEACVDAVARRMNGQEYIDSIDVFAELEQLPVNLDPTAEDEPNSLEELLEQLRSDE